MLHFNSSSSNRSFWLLFATHQLSVYCSKQDYLSKEKNNKKQNKDYAKTIYPLHLLNYHMSTGGAKYRKVVSGLIPFFCRQTQFHFPL